MTITSKVDFDDMYKVLDELEKGLLWQYIAQKVKAKVKKLMSLGIDVNGGKYKPYSKMYLPTRIDAGVALSPNLQLTSMMWKSIQARHTVDDFTIFIVGQFENEKAIKNNKTRKFFEWGTLLESEVNDAVDDYFRRLGF